MLLATLLLGVGSASFLRGPGATCPAFAGHHAAVNRAGLVVAAAKKEPASSSKKAEASVPKPKSKAKPKKADDAAILRSELEKMKTDYAQLQRSIEQQDRYIPELQAQLQSATGELQMAMMAMQMQQSQAPVSPMDAAAARAGMMPPVPAHVPQPPMDVSRPPPTRSQGGEGRQAAPNVVVPNVVVPNVVGRVVPTTDKAPPSNRTRGYDADKRRRERSQTNMPMPPQMYAMGSVPGAPPTIPKKEGPNLWGADNRRDMRSKAPPAPPVPKGQLKGPGPGANVGTSTEAVKKEDEPLRGAAARRAVRSAQPRIQSGYRVRAGAGQGAQPAAVDKDGEPLRGGAARRVARQQNPFQARPAVTGMLPNPYAMGGTAATAYKPASPYQAQTPFQRRKAMSEQIAAMPAAAYGYDNVMLRGANARRMGQIGGTYPIQTPYQGGLPATYAQGGDAMLNGADARRVARGAYSMGTFQTPYLPRAAPGMMHDPFDMPQLTWEWQGTFSS